MAEKKPPFGGFLGFEKLSQCLVGFGISLADLAPQAECLFGCWPVARENNALAISQFNVLALTVHHCCVAVVSNFVWAAMINLCRSQLAVGSDFQWVEAGRSARVFVFDTA